MVARIAGRNVFYDETRENKVVGGSFHHQRKKVSAKKATNPKLSSRHRGALAKGHIQDSYGSQHKGEVAFNLQSGPFNRITET